MKETLAALDQYFCVVATLLVIIGWGLVAIIRAIRGDKSDDC